MEFHLPYFALRHTNALLDPRKLRNAFPMLSRYSSSHQKSRDQSWYYEAQVSFLITGADEWYWTAYCCVDTASEEPETADMHINYKDDGPSGGGKREQHPLWNPREYFLFVLSRRCQQVTREWESLVYELISRLDTYVKSFRLSSSPELKPELT